jgi:DNA polymerase III alpha subunit
VFITLEDETDIANLIVWPSLFDRQRRIILGAQMMACRGRVQCASGVIHLIAEHLIDQTDLLSSVGGRDAGFTLPAGAVIRRGIRAAPIRGRTRLSRRCATSMFLTCTSIR